MTKRIELVIQLKNKDLPNELNEVIQFKNKDLPSELNELFNLKTKIYQTNWMSYSI